MYEARTRNGFTPRVRASFVFVRSADSMIHRAWFFSSDFTYDQWSDSSSPSRHPVDSAATINAWR
jgi:hypothetical protein